MITFSEDQQKIVDVLEAVNKKEINEVLDEIRAEIEAARYGLINDGLDVALSIIDKYTKGE